MLLYFCMIEFNLIMIIAFLLMAEKKKKKKTNPILLVTGNLVASKLNL